MKKGKGMRNAKRILSGLMVAAMLLGGGVTPATAAELDAAKTVAEQTVAGAAAQNGVAEKAATDATTQAAEASKTVADAATNEAGAEKAVADATDATAQTAGAEKSATDATVQDGVVEKTATDAKDAADAAEKTTTDTAQDATTQKNGTDTTTTDAAAEKTATDAAAQDAVAEKPETDELLGDDVLLEDGIMLLDAEPDAGSSGKVYTLESQGLTAFDKGGKKDGDSESAGTGNYFTIIYSSNSKVDSSSKKWDDGYKSSQRINFGKKAETNKNAVQFTTNGAATVSIWWVQGGEDNREMTILGSDGKSVATTSGTYKKNTAYFSTLSLDAAGTYYLGGATGNNYIFKVVVTETSDDTPAPTYSDWSTVAAPVIDSVTQNGGNVDVSVSANVKKYTAADYVEVTLTAADGTVVETKRSSAEATSHTLSFTPSASGTYTASARIVRNETVIDEAGNETTTTRETSAAETKSAEYVLPLGTPSVTSATNLGAGSVSVEWTSVTEATSYVVSVEGTGISKEVTDTKASVEGLTVDQTYQIKVAAKRGEELSESTGSIEVTVKNSAERKWSTSSYGTSINKANNGSTGNINDGSVTVYSESGKGKIVPGSTDGLTFYYTEIDPATENFTLTATVTVDSWTFSNGQEGFGLMVADAVGVDGDTTTFWNNSLQNIVSKIEYYWDGEAVTTDSSQTKITMKLGIGALARTGVTAQDVADFTSGKLTGNPADFVSETTTFEHSTASQGAGTYNIIGNYANASAPDGTQENALTTFRMQIQRNNTGYILRYLDESNNVLAEKLYYDLDRNLLTQIDSDHIYLGFFASRNARITVSDAALSIIAPEDDAPAEERQIETVYTINTIESATVANSAAYDLVYYGNADGQLQVVDASGKELYNQPFTALTKAHIAVTLAEGKNTYQVIFAPNADYKPGAYQTMSSYETVTLTHTVEYQTSTRNNIYISPSGTSTAAGTKADPMDLYTAVKKAVPGQKLLLMEGTYNLTKTVKVERGINGTAEKPIYLMADPEAGSRPVLDFGGNCAGMVLGGDYWYLQGFDVTKSADAQKGIQVSGNHNTLDRINTYRNGNTGIQISRYLSTDEKDQWPSYNLILNCSSYLNADKGYEDADGFAAKLTVGEGNVFDGCIAAYNADDGWDLYAKVQTGSIGSVTIQNCVAFKNGYVLDASGNEVNAGNGNGFKMGGESMVAGHVLKNSIAFANKAKGIDSNSCPDIKVYNSISYNNESYNVAFYTNTAVNTAFYASGILSYKDANTVAEQFKLKGTQNEADVKNETNYYFDGSKSANTAGAEVSADWFKSLDLAKAISLTNGGISRNADGTINLNGFLELTDAAPSGVGAVMTGQASATIQVVADPDNSGNNNNNSNNNSNSNSGQTVTATATPAPTATAALVAKAKKSSGSKKAQVVKEAADTTTLDQTASEGTEATAEPTPTATQTPEPTPEATEQPEVTVPTEQVEETTSQGGLSVGAVIGIIVAAVVVGGGAIAVAILPRKKK